VASKNNNLLPKVNFRPQLNIIRLVATPDPIKAQNVSLFNKKIKKKKKKKKTKKKNFIKKKKKKKKNQISLV